MDGRLDEAGKLTKSGVDAKNGGAAIDDMAALTADEKRAASYARGLLDELFRRLKATGADVKYRQNYITYAFDTMRDPLKRQRRMIGMGGKSRRKKQSPKR